MLNQIRHRWNQVWSTFWFFPALIVSSGIGLALGLIALESYFELPFLNRWPLLFGAGTDGSRGLLTSVAGSMITVAGVVFSITIVALSLTASQYTSRVLRNFMGDRVNQSVLGVFVGIYAYCLVVLRTIRGGDEGAFVPALAVFVGLLLAMLGIGFLIFFIHHISVSIQASSIIAVAAEETSAALCRLYPADPALMPAEADPGLLQQIASRHWRTIPSPKSGYIENVEIAAIATWAERTGMMVRMERGIGEFAGKSSALVSISGSGVVEENDLNQLTGLFNIGRHRTIQRDPSFGIRQIVDVALKALSPGINDTTTATMCVDYLGSVLAQLASRPIITPHVVRRGAVQVIAMGPTFESFLRQSFDQIRQNASGNPAVLRHLLKAFHAIAANTTDPARRKALSLHANLVAAEAQRMIKSNHDKEPIEDELARLKPFIENTTGPV